MHPHKQADSFMKEFFQMMRRFISPYKRYVAGAVALNILSERVLLLFAYPDTEYPVQDRRCQSGISLHGMGKRRYQRRGGQ